MSNDFSQKMTEILSLSKEEATRLRSRTINPEHLLLGIIRRGKGSALDIIGSMDIDLQELKERIEKRISSTSAIENPYDDNVEMSLSTARVLRFCTLEARSLKSPADAEHLLFDYARPLAAYNYTDSRFIHTQGEKQSCRRDT